MLLLVKLLQPCSRKDALNEKIRRLVLRSLTIKRIRLREDRKVSRKRRFSSGSAIFIPPPPLAESFSKATWQPRRRSSHRRDHLAHPPRYISFASLTWNRRVTDGSPLAKRRRVSSQFRCLLRLTGVSHPPLEGAPGTRSAIERRASSRRYKRKRSDGRRGLRARREREETARPRCRRSMSLSSFSLSLPFRSTLTTLSF